MMPVTNDSSWITHTGANSPPNVVSMSKPVPAPSPNPKIPSQVLLRMFRILFFGTCGCLLLVLVVYGWSTKVTAATVGNALALNTMALNTMALNRSSITTIVDQTYSVVATLSNNSVVATLSNNSVVATLSNNSVVATLFNNSAVFWSYGCYLGSANYLVPFFKAASAVALRCVNLVASCLAAPTPEPTRPQGHYVWPLLVVILTAAFAKQHANTPKEEMEE